MPFKNRSKQPCLPFENPSSLNKEKVMISMSFTHNDLSPNGEEKDKYLKYNENHSSMRESVFSQIEKISNPNDQLFINNSEELISNIDHINEESTKTQELLQNKNVQAEFKNFTDIIKNKILKINNVNLCIDFVNYIDNEKFCHFIDSYMKIKVFRRSLEQIKIPPFRNFAKNSLDKIEAMRKEKSNVSKNNSNIKTKTRFYLIIGLLIIIVILIIVVLIIFLTRGKK